VGAVVAGSAIAEQQDVDALVVLDLPTKRSGVVGLRVHDRDQVDRLRPWRDGVDRGPDAKNAEPYGQQRDATDEGQCCAGGSPPTCRAERDRCAPPARLPYQGAASESSESDAARTMFRDATEPDGWTSPGPVRLAGPRPVVGGRRARHRAGQRQPLPRAS